MTRSLCIVHECLENMRWLGSVNHDIIKPLRAPSLPVVHDLELGRGLIVVLNDGNIYSHVGSCVIHVTCLFSASPR